jgi:hypothetical protein
MTCTDLVTRYASTGESRHAGRIPRLTLVRSAVDPGDAMNPFRTVPT